MNVILFSRRETLAPYKEGGKNGKEIAVCQQRLYTAAVL